MKKHFSVVAFALVVALVGIMCCSCTKQEEKVTTTTIFGTVADAQTGALSAVRVSFGEGDQYSGGGFMETFWEAYASAITGTDGHFEMTFSQTDKNRYDNDFFIRAEKSGYYSYYEERHVVLGEGNKYQMDILLRK